MTAVPRLVVSAPSSGHGKTAVTVGMLAAFADAGLRAAGFKVGPDHTDAAFLGLAAGRLGRNLDPRMVGTQRVAPLFAHGAAGADIAVVEGTMGLFDSLAGRSEADSTAGVAGLLRAPVVLVIDVAAMGQSVAALVHGFRAYDELIWLGGVVLNRVASDRHELLLREALDEIGVPVLGVLRRGDLAVGGPAALPPREQGVVPVLHRTVEATRAVRRLGETVAAAVDLERLLALARSAPRLAAEPWSAVAAEPVVTGGRRPVVALAGTPGMAYGYAETAELLVGAGADVRVVDPLRDDELPAETAALVVCGGLPEGYAEELSANVRLNAAVADLARSGSPVVAEGTGLLWLAREFDGRPMCGVLDASGASSDRVVVGYREATAQASSAVAPAGTRVVGYKQHRSDLTPRAGQTPAWAWNGGSPEGFVWRRVHASYLTLHWAGLPDIAERLVAAAVRSAGPAPQDGAGPPVNGSHPPARPEIAGTPLPAQGARTLARALPGEHSRVPAHAVPAEQSRVPAAAHAVGSPAELDALKGPTLANPAITPVGSIRAGAPHVAGGPAVGSVRAGASHVAGAGRSGEPAPVRVEYLGDAESGGDHAMPGEAQAAESWDAVDGPPPRPGQGTG